MDFATIIDAGLTAALTICSAASACPSTRQLQAAVLGGVSMGVGIRLSFGCDSEAFLASSASDGLHGWICFVLVLAGSFLGMRLRIKFVFQRDEYRGTNHSTEQIATDL